MEVAFWFSFTTNFSSVGINLKKDSFFAKTSTALCSNANEMLSEI